MKNGLWVLFLICALTTTVCRAVDEESLRDGYRLTNGSCDKKPLGPEAGEAAADAKLEFNDFRQTAVFLGELSQYVYQFDQKYARGVADLVAKSNDSDLVSIFAMNALTPFLKGLEYPMLKRRYVDVALDNLVCLNKQFQIESLASLKDIAIFQDTAVRLLVRSWETARSLLSETQKAKGAELIRFLGDILAKGLTAESLASIQAKTPDISGYILGWSPNPFLRSRSATDLALIQYLNTK